MIEFTRRWSNAWWMRVSPRLVPVVILLVALRPAERFALFDAFHDMPAISKYQRRRAASPSRYSSHDRRPRSGGRMLISH
jgi:hypothetical protein